MKYEDNNSNNSGNNGNKGKFSERIKKIRRDRLKRKKNLGLNDEYNFVLRDTSRNILKVILAIPSVVYTHVTDSKVHNKKQLNKIIKNNTTFDYSALSINPDNIQISAEHKKIKVNRIKEIDVSLLKKKREYILREYNNKNELTHKLIDNNVEKVKLQKEIIDLIKKNLINNINELEMLQSELYILNQLENGEIYLNECQQDIKEIKKLLSKVKSLKEKYDYLKDNIDFEYMLEYDDNLLIDKILELKEICSREDIKNTIDDYKILDEYKYLYLKIDKLQEDMIKMEKYKDNKVEELKQRDIDFDRLKKDVYDVDREKERYDSFVKNQELILRELDEKIMKIDSHERVTYRLKGFHQLLGNSFKYLGLLLVNPLKGLVPGIATQTLVTKNMIHNLYNSLEWEENKRIVYDAIDYSSSIHAAINNLDDTASLVDSTLRDLIELKGKYKKEFSKYEGKFSSYIDAIKKINKIENVVFGSKIKIEHMRVRMMEKERQNSSKLKMVKKLNNSSNN